MAERDPEQDLPDWVRITQHPDVDDGFLVTEHGQEVGYCCSEICAHSLARYLVHLENERNSRLADRLLSDAGIQPNQVRDP